MIRHNIYRLFIALAFASLAAIGKAEPTFELVDRPGSATVVPGTIDVTYRVAITNDGDALQDVSVQVRSSATATVPIDDMLNFGDVAAGATVPSVDTFEIRHDLSEPYDLTVLSYEILDDEPVDGIEITVDPDNTNTTTVASEGGTLVLATTTNALVTLEVPVFAVREETVFSASEITGITGFPDGITPLVAARMGPAGTDFFRPVTLTFDVTGQRTPGTALAAFIIDEDGSNLRFVPVLPADPNAGVIETARLGDRVRVNSFGFSDIGLVEVASGARELIVDLASDPDTVNLDALNTIIEFALGDTLEEGDEDELFEILESLVIEARENRAGPIEAFTDREVMTDDMLEEFRSLVLKSLITEQLAQSLEITIREETISVYESLIEMSAAYVAGLHLQCFVDRDGLDPVLAQAAVTSLLTASNALLAEVPGPSFEEIAAYVDTIDECYAAPVLEAYFESLDADGDFLSGMTSNVVVTTIDNGTGASDTSEGTSNPVGFAFFEPKLQSASPLFVSFQDITSSILVGDPVTATVLFQSPGASSREGLLTVAKFSELVIEAEEAGDDDGLLVFDSSGTGTITVTPTSFVVEVDFSRSISLDPAGENQGTTEIITGTYTGSRTFKPREFAEEFD